MPFMQQAHFASFRKVALLVVYINPVQSFRVEKEKPFLQHKQLQSLLS